MALSKIQTGLVDTNAIGSTELNLADNYTFTGTIKKTGQPMFSASGNTSQWIDLSTTNSSWYWIKGGTARSDSGSTNGDWYYGVNWTSTTAPRGQQGSHFNTATGAFTAPVAGFYKFYFQCYSSKTSTNTGAYFYLNGVINDTIQPDYQLYGYGLGGSTYVDGVNTSRIYYLNANDTFRFATMVNVNSSFNAYGDYFKFAGYLIG